MNLMSEKSERWAALVEAVESGRLIIEGDRLRWNGALEATEEVKTMTVTFNWTPEGVRAQRSEEPGIVARVIRATLSVFRLG